MFTLFEYPVTFDLNEILLFAVFVLFIIGFIGQMCYYWFIFRKLAFYKENKSPQQEQAVSVVICARNEYYNLKRNLTLLLEQDYPEFEVIVVNDSSEDDTKELLDFYTRRYGNLKVFNLEQNLNFFKGKKFPLSLGIKSAKHELILLTDADCMPASNQWIREMQQNFNDNTDIVLGYGAYEKKAGFLNKLIRFDAFHIAIQYLSFSLSGKTYMGVGRNLAYRRNLFIGQKGFSSHYKIHSGDDDLFINSVATKRNSVIQVSKPSHTISVAKTTYDSWVYQKKRHFVTGKYYKKGIKKLLGFYSLSKFILYFAFIPLAVMNYNLIVAGTALLLILVSQQIIYKKCAEKLDESDLLVFSFFLDVVMVVMNPLIYFSNFVTKPDKWK